MEKVSNYPIVILLIWQLKISSKLEHTTWHYGKKYAGHTIIIAFWFELGVKDNSTNSFTPMKFWFGLNKFSDFMNLTRRFCISSMYWDEADASSALSSAMFSRISGSLEQWKQQSASTFNTFWLVRWFWCVCTLPLRKFRVYYWIQVVEEVLSKKYSTKFGNCSVSLTKTLSKLIDREEQCFSRCCVSTSVTFETSWKSSRRSVEYLKKKWKPMAICSRSTISLNLFTNFLNALFAVWRAHVPR